MRRPRSLPALVLRLSMVLVLASCAAAAAPPAADDPAARARALSADARRLIEGGKLVEAEAALVGALGLRPADPGNLYNLACVRARLGRPDEAMDGLERAAGAGFADFGLIGRDPDLASLRELPRYRRLVARKEQYLRHGAEGMLVALRNRFGDGYQYVIDDEQRLVFATHLDAAALAALRARLREQADALRAALFGAGPEAYVTVLMPSPADYGKLVRFRNVPGLYVDATKTLVARETDFVLTHEYAHALHAADRAALGQAEHAPWVNEGFGAMCEAADFAGGAFTPRDNPRFAKLIAAAGRRALIPLARLVAMPQRDFIRRPNLTYGQSAYLMLYLHEQGLLRKFYEGYKAGFDQDKTGQAALENVTGMKLPELHEAWAEWLAAR